MSRYRILAEGENSQFSEYIDKVKSYNSERGELFAYIQTFGCQQNVADSERIAGMCQSMGYKICDDPADADIIVVMENGEINGIK